MPKLSVIIPVYNLSDYLEACVESLYPLDADAEILLIDDGSSDGSAALCDRLSERHPEVRVIHQPNGGASAARNTGMREAEADWLMFVDGDDTVRPGAVRTAAENVAPDTDVTVFGGFFGAEDGTWVSLQSYRDADVNAAIRGGEVFRTLFLYPMPWLYVISKAFIRQNGLYMRDGLLDEDEEWTGRLFAAQPRVRMARGSYYCYRDARSGSLTDGRRPENTLADIGIIRLLENERQSGRYSAAGCRILQNKCRSMVNKIMDDTENYDRRQRRDLLRQLKPYRKLLKSGTNGDRIHYVLDGLLGRRATRRLLAELVKIKHHGGR